MGKIKNNFCRDLHSHFLIATVSFKRVSPGQYKFICLTLREIPITSSLTQLPIVGTVTSNYTLTADSGHGHQSLQIVLLSAILVRSVVQHLDGEENKSDHDDIIHLPQAHTQHKF